MSEHWLDQMAQIAKDFENADVRSFMFRRIDGKVTCKVSVAHNSDGALTTWELVDDGVSSDQWRKVVGPVPTACRSKSGSPDTPPR